MSRYFEQTVCLGGPHAKEMMELLIARVHQAFSISGGLQQPGRPETKEQAEWQAKEDAEWELKRQDIVLDVLGFFGYADVELKHREF